MEFHPCFWGPSVWTLPSFPDNHCSELCSFLFSLLFFMGVWVCVCVCVCVSFSPCYWNITSIQKCAQIISIQCNKHSQTDQMHVINLDHEKKSYQYSWNFLCPLPATPAKNTLLDFKYHLCDYFFQGCIPKYILCRFVCLFWFYCFLGLHPAYGNSQARGQIRAVAAGLHHSHSNTRSESRLQPTPQIMAVLDP